MFFVGIGSDHAARSLMPSDLEVEDTYSLTIWPDPLLLRPMDFKEKQWALS